jgi:hypothetical protein
MLKHLTARLAVFAMLAAPPPLLAQESPEPAPPPPAGAPSADDGVVETVAMPSADEQIDVAAINLPALAFAPDPDSAKDFDKYYYFHRADTDFRAALADIRDCDGLSRGLSSPYGNASVPYPYAGTMAGAVGGAIGNLMVAAIFGSAQKRAARRVNMRRCMFFKGYQRYGLPKNVWEKFNFEEGLSTVEEKKRQAYLMQQAKAASGDRPRTEALGR